MNELPADDVELAELLLAHWDEGRGTPKSQLERVAWQDESSHGRRFDRFIRQVLGVETSMPSKQSDRIAELVDQVRSLGGRPRGVEPPVWEPQLLRARSAALDALTVWNDPVAEARFEPFALGFVRAWSALSVAILQLRSQDWQQLSPGDGGSNSSQRSPAGSAVGSVTGPPAGEPSTPAMPLDELLDKAFPGDDNAGLRANVEYWASLTGLVGERHLPALDSIVAPQVQAGLINLERELVLNFGPQYQLGRSLTVPLELNGFRDQTGFATPKALIRTLPEDVQQGLARFDEPRLLEDPRFAIRLAVVPIAGAAADHFDAVAYHARPGAVPDELDAAVDRHLAVPKVVRPPRPNLIARDVVEQVQSRIPFKFTMNGHTEATYRLKVRSRRGDNTPDSVDPKYCEWVSSVKRHLFNQEWVDRLSELLSTEAGYERAVGRKPEPR